MSVIARCSAVRLLGAVAGALFIVLVLAVRIHDLGWGALEVVLGCATFVSLALMAATYPLRTVFDAEGVRIRTPVRTRVIPWLEVQSVRRTRGRQVVTSSGLRAMRGGLVLVTRRGTVLVTDRCDSAEFAEQLATMLDRVSPALADSIRSTSASTR